MCLDEILPILFRNDLVMLVFKRKLLQLVIQDGSSLSLSLHKNLYIRLCLQVSYPLTEIFLILFRNQACILIFMKEFFENIFLLLSIFNPLCNQI